MTTKSLHLMILEDEEADVEAIRRAYEDAGADVEIRSVGTLREFRESVHERQPDLALMDLNLPDGRAVELLTHPPEDAPFPVLIMTAFGTQQIVVEVMKAGALDYVVKSPAAFATMPRIVEHALREWELLQKGKRDAEVLRKSEAKFSRAFQTAPYAITITDSKDGNFIEVNQAFFSITGFTQEETLSNSSFGLKLWVNEEDRQNAVDDLRAGRAVLSREYAFRTKSGNIITGLFSAQMIQLSHGLCILSSINDITERKREEAYREMAREVLQILNAPGDVPDSIGRVLDALKTRTGFDAVGIRLQEGDDFPYLIQQGFSKDFLLTENTLIGHAADGGICRDKDGKLILECTCGLVISGKIDPANPLFTKEGSCWTNDSFPLLEIPPGDDPRFHPRNHCIHQGYVSLALVPIRAQNKIVGLIQFNDRRKGCFTPGTLELLEGIAAHIGSALMRKQMAEEKARLEAQFHQAQKMESVGRLAGGVAHDFNNMLGVILGFTELAMERVDPDDPLHADLSEVYKAATRSTGIVQQLLAFARKQIITPIVLDLNDTVANMLKMLRRLIGEDIDLAWMPGADLWQIMMDPSQMDQLLANLCVNARDAITDVGKVTIETKNAVIDEVYREGLPDFIPGEFVRLAVNDNGCGMDKETQGQIFEPFFTTKETGKGTGLGLSTVYGIVKQNKGFINIYSEPGQGTTFAIYLPRHEDKAGRMRKEGPAEPDAHGSETILLVEDEPSILKMTTRMLERLGYTVLAASTPGEAIRLARERKGKIHLLMTDVVMPEMNGRDLTKNLVSLYPNLKSLFMSGYTADIIVHHGVLDAGVHFIQKPFSVKNLAAKLRTVLNDE